MEEAKARRKARRNVKAKVAGALLLIVALGTVVSVVPAAWAQTPTGLSGELTIAGSTTVLPINQECARLLMVANPDLRISVSGGGSGHGVKAAGAGEIDIGAVSRDVKSSEREQYPDLKPVAIGKDSVAIVVHPSNAITALTLEQAAKIFSGEITNWKEVGGADAAIRVITREEGSGTRETFETYVMTPFGRETAAKAFVKASNGEVRATVSSDYSSIGYLSLGYVDETVKALSIGGIAATVDNVVSGTYPISRNLYLITKGTPSTLEAAFIDFVLSSEGQKVVEDMGYIKIGTAVTPSQTPAPTTTPTLVTTPTSTSTPTPEEPGFEAAGAIAGLLAVTYLAVRSRKRR
jgi:phosphate transport system substrate-binding protein